MKTRWALFLVLPAVLTAAASVIAEGPERAPIAVLPDAIVWAPGPPSLPEGASSAILEGNPAREGFFTMRVRLPAGFVIPPHTHPESERVTVMSGSVCVGFGETADRERARCFPAGSFYVNPPATPHAVWSDSGATLQITGVGPWDLEYLDPANDPRSRKPER